MSRDIWLISDTHFNHKNILSFTQGGQPVREFDSVEQMNQCIMDNWSETVKPDDTIIHLGDVLFGENKVVWMENNFTKLPGKKRLVLGNHDNPKFLMPFFKDINFWIDLPGHILTHMPLHPQTLGENKRWGGQDMINVHGHTHRNPSPEGPYKCVCVEQTNFKPINFEDIVSEDAK